MNRLDIKINYPLLLVAFFFLLSWLLPNHYFPWLTFYQESLAFMGGFILLGYLIFLGEGTFPAKLMLMFFFPLIPMGQYFFGVIYFFGDAFIVSLYLLAFAMMVMVGYSLALNYSQRIVIVRLLAVVFIVGAVLSLWIALRQWLLLSGVIWEAELPLGWRPFANFAQPNSLATLLCLGAAGILYFYEKYFLGRLSAGVLTAFLVFGIALTQSRTPWVAVVVVVVFWWWKSAGCKRRMTLVPLLSWVGFYVVCLLALPSITELIGLSSIDPFSRGLSSTRLDLWLQFLYALWEGPFWGYGWSQVAQAQVGVSLLYPVPLITEHSHNLLLDLLLWNGLFLGGGIILFLSIWLLRLGFKSHSDESVFALLAVGFVLVHAMLEFPVEYAFFLLPMGMLLGVATAEFPSFDKIVFPRSLLAGALVLGVITLGWIGSEYREIEKDHRLMRFENARIAEQNKAGLAPDVMMLTQLRDFIRFARTPRISVMTVEQVEWMGQVAHRYPFSSSLYRYAVVLGVNGQPLAAREQLLILRALHGEEAYEQSVFALQNLAISQPLLSEVLVDLPSQALQ